MTGAGRSVSVLLEDGREVTRLIIARMIARIKGRLHY
jgi:hypothetical protein